MTQQARKTRQYILWGLFTALTAVASQIIIPLPFTPVPINLATLSVFLAGGLLGAKGGAISQLIYLLLGAVGVPVFAGFTGGPGIVAGPTGGYIIGYVLAAWAIGFLINLPAPGLLRSPAHQPSELRSPEHQPSESHQAKGNGKRAALSFIHHSVIMAFGLALCYVVGTAWFVYITGTGLGPALVMCVLPFLPGDILKIALASVLVARLRKLI